MATLDCNGAVGELESDIADYNTAENTQTNIRIINGKKGNSINRFIGVAPIPPYPNENQGNGDRASTLAVFCFEDPASPIGGQLRNVVAALARRNILVHLFSRIDFEIDNPRVTAHPVGECPGDDPLERVQEFAQRACNVFLQWFPGCSDQVTVMACEWSAIPALTILHGIKNVPTLLSLGSLERQRVGMAGTHSHQIEEIELTGLRQARTILVQNPETAETIKFWAADCANRLVAARQPFPVQQFERDLDPGEIKARYQVGPVDPTILFIGDLSERYGPDILVKALPPVLKNHKQTRLIVVGDGPLYWPLRVYTRYLLLENEVRLVGNVEGQSLQELIQAADIVVTPSREQTPWWPILAGWAARRPVVATRETASALLEHDNDSVLVYPTENSLVWGLERILFDPEFGGKIGCQGRLKLEDRFGWNFVAEQIEELMGALQPR